MNQSWHSGQKDIKVALSDRVIMSPHAARRLSVFLSNVLQNYEKQFGKLGSYLRLLERRMRFFYAPLLKIRESV